MSQSLLLPKPQLSAACNDWIVKNAGKTLSIYDILPLAIEAYLRILSSKEQNKWTFQTWYLAFQQNGMQ